MLRCFFLTWGPALLKCCGPHATLTRHWINPKYFLPARTAVPNQGFPDPWGSETRYLGINYEIFEDESLYVRGCTVFKITEVYESLQVLVLSRILSSLVIPANVTNLTIKVATCVRCYFCFTVQLPRWKRPVCYFCFTVQLPRWKRPVKCLWSNYGKRVVWCYRTRKFMVFNHAKYRKLSTKALSILVPFATTYLCESGFSSLLHWKGSIRTVWTPLTIFVWLWVIVCQGMGG